MAIKGLSLSEKEAYILKDDPGHPDNAEKSDEKPTIFYIGNLTNADRIEIGDITMTPTMSNSGVSMSMQRMKRIYLTVQRGLKGWENFTDGNDKPIPFEEETANTGGSYRKVASEASMLRLTSEQVVELSEAILKKNGMTKELAKNSAAVSPPSLETLLMGGTAMDVPPTNSENEGAE